jgi:hypothetical protein
MNVLWHVRIHLSSRSLRMIACRYIASGPLVRSSYKAGEFFLEAMIKGDRQAAPA